MPEQVAAPAVTGNQHAEAPAADSKLATPKAPARVEVEKPDYEKAQQYLAVTDPKVRQFLADPQIVRDRPFSILPTSKDGVGIDTPYIGHANDPRIMGAYVSGSPGEIDKILGPGGKTATFKFTPGEGLGGEVGRYAYARLEEKYGKNFQDSIIPQPGGGQSAPEINALRAEFGKIYNERLNQLNSDINNATKDAFPPKGVGGYSELFDQVAQRDTQSFLLGNVPPAERDAKKKETIALLQSIETNGTAGLGITKDQLSALEAVAPKTAKELREIFSDDGQGGLTTSGKSSLFPKDKFDAAISRLSKVSNEHDMPIVPPPAPEVLAAIKDGTVKVVDTAATKLAAEQAGADQKAKTAAYMAEHIAVPAPTKNFTDWMKKGNEEIETVEHRDKETAGFVSTHLLAEKFKNSIQSTSASNGVGAPGSTYSYITDKDAQAMMTVLNSASKGDKEKLANEFFRVTHKDDADALSQMSSEQSMAYMAGVLRGATSPVSEQMAKRLAPDFEDKRGLIIASEVRDVLTGAKVDGRYPQPAQAANALLGLSPDQMKDVLTQYQSTLGGNATELPSQLYAKLGRAGMGDMFKESSLYGMFPVATAKALEACYGYFSNDKATMADIMSNKNVIENSKFLLQTAGSFADYYKQGADNFKYTLDQLKTQVGPDVPGIGSLNIAIANALKAPSMTGNENLSQGATP